VFTQKKSVTKTINPQSSRHTSDACRMRTVSSIGLESVSMERPLQKVQTKSTSTACDAVTTHGTTSKMFSLCVAMIKSNMFGKKERKHNIH
jgi:hypothetical protein